jgi:hypothetical protein
MARTSSGDSICRRIPQGEPLSRFYVGQVANLRRAGNPPPAAQYIEMNPVKAGLVETPEAFPWSSARPIDNRPQVNNLPQLTVIG